MLSKVLFAALCVSADVMLGSVWRNEDAFVLGVLERMVYFSLFRILKMGFISNVLAQEF